MFLGMIGLFSWPAVVMMTVSKMVGALFVFLIARRREKLLL